MMPSSHSVLGVTIECAMRNLEAAVAALEVGDKAAAAAAFADLSVHADTARRILDLRPYDDIEGEAGGGNAFKPFQNRFKTAEDANPNPTGAGTDAETPSQALTAPFSFLPESRLSEVAERRRSALARRVLPLRRETPHHLESQPVAQRPADEAAADQAETHRPHEAPEQER